MLKHTCEAICPWAFVCCKFFTTATIILYVVGLFMFSISYCFSPGRLYFSKNLSISFKLSNLLAYTFFLGRLLWFFAFQCFLLQLLFILILLIWVCALIFSLMILANGLSIFSIYSKNQLLVLVIIAIIAFFYFFIHFCSDFYDFFLLILVFCCSFSSCFRCKSRLSILCHSYFLW